MIEIKKHPWFVGVQFHPELKSRILDAHPLFKDFIFASIVYRNEKIHSCNILFMLTAVKYVRE